MHLQASLQTWGRFRAMSQSVLSFCPKTNTSIPVLDLTKIRATEAHLNMLILKLLHAVAVTYFPLSASLH